MTDHALIFVKSKIIPVEDVRIGDIINFTPGDLNHAYDRVTKVHLRDDSIYPLVTISHIDGCWSKEVGEKVELIGRFI